MIRDFELLIAVLRLLMLTMTLRDSEHSPSWLHSQPMHLSNTDRLASQHMFLVHSHRILQQSSVMANKGTWLEDETKNEKVGFSKRSAQHCSNTTTMPQRSIRPAVGTGTGRMSPGLAGKFLYVSVGLSNVRVPLIVRRCEFHL